MVFKIQGFVQVMQQKSKPEARSLPWPARKFEIFKLLEGVVRIQSNRYCLCALTEAGELWVNGFDKLHIGILGLGLDREQTRSFERVGIKAPVVQFSLTDCYCAALTQSNHVYIWGSAFDHLLGSLC